MLGGGVEGREIWEWTKKLIAWILRMDPVWISHEWTLRPQFHIWPPRRHRGITLRNCAHGVVQGTIESDAVRVGVS
jgi:hypothetical protein